MDSWDDPSGRDSVQEQDEKNAPHLYFFFLSASQCAAESEGD